MILMKRQGTKFNFLQKFYELLYVPLIFQCTISDAELQRTAISNLKSAVCAFMFGMITCERKETRRKIFLLLTV